MSLEAKTAVFALLLAMGLAASEIPVSASILPQQQHQPSVARFQSMIRESQNSPLANCDSGAAESYDSYLMTPEDNSLNNKIDINRIGDQFRNVNKDCFWVVAGGFQERTDCWAPRTLVDALVAKGCTVIFADWQQAAGRSCYDHAFPPPGQQVDPIESLICYSMTTSALPQAARSFAELLAKVCQEADINPEDIKMAGLSLGSHFLGVVGRTFQENDAEDRQIGTIVGLDPAGPGYSPNPLTEPFCAEWHLNSSDARCVTFINTNVGNLGTVSFEKAHTAYVIDGGVTQATNCMSCEGTDGVKDLPCAVCSHGVCVRILIAFIQGKEISVCSEGTDQFCESSGKLNLQCGNPGVYRNAESFVAPSFDPQYAMC